MTASQINYRKGRYIGLTYRITKTMSIAEGSKNIYYWDLIDLSLKGILICEGDRGPKWMDQDKKGRIKIIGVDMI